MKRRTFVATASGVVLGGVAGCQAPAGDEETETAVEETTAAEAETTAAETETTAAEAETTTVQEEQGGAVETVQMVTEGSEFFFDPVGLFVEPGDTVKWVIESGSHSTTAYAESLDAASVTRIPNEAEPWNSGILSESGASFSYTFDVSGTYDYFCLPHKTLGMIARIVCGEPGDVEGDPPDGDVPAEQRIVEEGAISYDEWKE